jgi:hypothetical protein
MVFHVQPQTARLAEEARRRALLAQPPVAEIAERHRGVARQRLEALALPFRLPLEVEREPLRLRLCACRGALVVPRAGRISVAHVPPLPGAFLDELAAGLQPRCLALETNRREVLPTASRVMWMKNVRLYALAMVPSDSPLAGKHARGRLGSREGPDLVRIDPEESADLRAGQPTTSGRMADPAVQPLRTRQVFSPVGGVEQFVRATCHAATAHHSRRTDGRAG